MWILIVNSAGIICMYINVYIHYKYIHVDLTQCSTQLKIAQVVKALLVEQCCNNKVIMAEQCCSTNNVAHYCFNNAVQY